ncbi:hypothetical protein SLS60_002262 [Paraconiothyrium brasiliense]|uniref:Uncharacterized protein n=1 Tax=Paraconiothyrium brasiliense TaxID=300254 RepID=A0ABR3S1N1_9PLEO
MCYRNFLPNANSIVHNMTKEDIVRSSLWIDENGFEDAITAEKPNITRLMESMIDANKTLGKFPGAFAVPICRNPRGEAISSVWTKSGRNYPCKCGEVLWSDKDYDWKRDKTRKFLERTGFKFSEDWEDYCSDNNKCKGEADIDWNFWVGPQEGKIPKKLKHPFKTCKSPKEHQWGHPGEDPGVQWRKREVEEMTWQEVQRAELELWAKQLEERQTGYDRSKEHLAT